MSFNHMNRVTIIGNVGREIEHRTFQNGGEIATFTVATSESWKDKNSGERKQKTHWHNVVVKSPPLVKIAVDYVNKGDLVMVEGQLETRKWKDQSGNDKFTTEIVVQGFNSTLKTFRQKGEGGSSSGSSDDGYGESTAGDKYNDDIDDEIPF